MSERQPERIDKNKAPGLCMVVGCKGKSLYKKNIASVVRGYCADHKALALSPMSKSSMRFLTWEERGQ